MRYVDIRSVGSLPTPLPNNGRTNRNWPMTAPVQERRLCLVVNDLYKKIVTHRDKMRNI
jgi:hypothetical protein